MLPKYHLKGFPVYSLGHQDQHVRYHTEASSVF